MEFLCYNKNKDISELKSQLDVIETRHEDKIIKLICPKNQVKTLKTKWQLQPSSEVQLSIEGMTCNSCIKTITIALKQNRDVIFNSINLEQNMGWIYFTNSQLKLQDIVDLIEDCSFDVQILSSHLLPPEVEEQDFTISTRELNDSTSRDSDEFDDEKATLIEINNDGQLVTTNIKVEGMTCSSCVASIESQLRTLEGVDKVTVSLITEMAEIIHYEKLVTVDQLVSDIEDMGFEPTFIDSTNGKDDGLKRVNLQVYGMSCSSCVRAIETGLMAVDGIIKVEVNLISTVGTVEYDSQLIGTRNIIKELKELGFYSMIQVRDTNTQLQSLSKIKEVLKWRQRFWFCFSLAVPMILVMKIGPHISLFKQVLLFRLWRISLGTLFQLALSTPIQFYIGKPFYQSSYAGIKHGTTNMDVLIVIGTSFSYGFSLLAILHSVLFYSELEPKLFLETSVMLFLFVTFGRFLENKAKGKTSSALSQLISLTPNSSTLVKWDAITKTVLEEEKISSDLIQVGDIIKVYPGEKMPTDGTVLFGNSTVDESMLTGESLPISKKQDDQVIGGTVNDLGSLIIKVDKIGADTMLAKIVGLVEMAQVSKAPIQNFADKIAQYFVPTVVTMGLCTFFVWCWICSQRPTWVPMHMHMKEVGSIMLSLTFAISVIVVSCPCALGLATPTAVMVGTGVGAQNGILIKGGEVLESAYKISKIVFDKTGTLTYGKMELVEIKSFTKKFDQSFILKVTAASEANSEHPLGRALTSYCHNNQVQFMNLKVDQFEAIVGHGIQCTVNVKDQSYQVKIGKLSWLQQNTPQQLLDQIVLFKEGQEKKGRTIIFISINEQIQGCFALADTIRLEALATIKALRKINLKVCMITGDQPLTAKAIGVQCGIEEIYSSITPEGKADLITEFKAAGETVCMIGDGINDSPALVNADVGISLGGGSDVAIEAAKIVLMKTHLFDIFISIDLSRFIFQRIRMNFIWATLYNFFAIPLAMGLFLPYGLRLHPIMASALMAFSSVSVVVSSLLLRLYRKPSFDVDRNAFVYDKLPLISDLYTWTKTAMGSSSYEPLDEKF